MSGARRGERSRATGWSRQVYPLVDLCPPSARRPLWAPRASPRCSRWTTLPMIRVSDGYRSRWRHAMRPQISPNRTPSLGRANTVRRVDARVFPGAALILAATLAAHGRASASQVLNHADGHLVEVSVLVDGAPAPLYLRPGHWDREYFQAFKKKNYALQITNNSSQRVAVLISVDGLNVVDGKKSKLA